MQYQEAWSFLDQLQFFKIKLGLDSMAAFLAHIHNPQKNLKCVHIAGTNGKGSVAVTLLTILRKAGYKTGLYTSPHLSSVRERFRINDRFISENEFAETATIIRNSLAGQEITYFEFTTALALLWFARQKVDLAILEVGLGGRLDATNVITPLISIITNVSMDHEAHLGSSLELIAAEKAGIVKQYIPVVSGVSVGEALDVVSLKCQEKKAPLYQLTRDFKAERRDDGFWNYYGPEKRIISQLPMVLRGEHQLENAAIALTAIDLLQREGFAVQDARIREALAEVSWPGRLEYFCFDLINKKVVDCPASLATKSRPVRHYLLDGAHNPAGILSLIKSLQRDFCYRKLICVWASMSDKDINKTLNVIAPLCHCIIFTRPETVRSATPEMLQSFLPVSLHNRVKSAETVEEALVLAEDESEAEDLICVAGSLYLIGAVRKILRGEIVDGNGKGSM